MTRALVIALVTGLVVIGLVGGFLYYMRPPAAPVTITAPAKPENRLVPVLAGEFGSLAPVDGEGEPADMTPYRGKILLVNLWATWCAPCIEELPSLGKLQTMLGSENFQVVTVAVDERDPAKIAPFLKEHGAGNLPVLVDISRTIDKIAQVNALPTSLLVARDGKVKAMLVGDARWHCGKALDAVKSFIADGSVKEFVLAACE